jgi:adenine deaminase
MHIGGEDEIAGQLLDIHAREIYPARVIIAQGRIQEIIRTASGPKRVIVPGLIDAHIHIESSMVTPGAFSLAAVRHGTVAVVSDPHEIANVMGIDGVKFMIEDSLKVPLRFFFGAPSCVPATDFETSGGVLNSNDVEELLASPDIKYLSEMMNYPGVVYEDAEVVRKLEAARKAGKPVDGHAPGLTGEMLKIYSGAGISTDHECSSIDEAREKLALGMKILIREGSAARNLGALKQLLKSNPDAIMLCSDDLHPEMLQVRHINKIVSQLVKDGYDIFDVIRSATRNPSDHYSLDSGLLRAGDRADIVVADSIARMNVLETWIGGIKVFDRGEVLFGYTPGPPVNRFNCSGIDKDSITVKKKPGKVRVITALEGELLTGEHLWDPGEGDLIHSDIHGDILKIVVKDRYNDSPPATGFIRGFGLKRGAFAGSVAHDSHNIVCVGTNDDDIVSAVNEVVRLKGGLSVCANGILKSLPLNIAGIMSDRTVAEVAEEYEQLSSIVQENGCIMQAPYMTLSFMALLVIPDLKIGDKGLFDVRKFQPVSLFVT